MTSVITLTLQLTHAQTAHSQNLLLVPTAQRVQSLKQNIKMAQLRLKVTEYQTRDLLD